jgi:hypothetical protein
LDTNAEPLLVNYVDTWRLRPEAVTRVPNFFLASDYVRTFTDLATMEAANEAARRAVNGVLRTAAAEGEPCELWNLHEPEVFLPLRAYDRVRYLKGTQWDARAIGVARSLTMLASDSALSSILTRSGGPVAVAREAVQSTLGSTPELLAARDGSSATSANEATQNDSVEVAADARASSDQGLPLLRIVRATL